MSDKEQKVIIKRERGNTCCSSTLMIIISAFAGVVIFWIMGMGSNQPIYVDANNKLVYPPKGMTQRYIGMALHFIVNKWNGRTYDETRDLMNNPFFKRMLLRVRRDGLLNKIEELSDAEMDRSMTYGRSFDSTYINMEVYLNQSWPGKDHFGFRDRSCISHQHVTGYEGPAKKFVVMALNDGSRFIRMTNMSMVGHGSNKIEFKYSSTLCPDKTVRLKRYNRIDIQYRPYNKIVPYQKHKNKHGDKYYYMRFEGEKAICLQVILDEFEGMNVCNKTIEDIS